MKLFLRKIIVFIASFYIALLLIFFGSNYFISSKADFKLQPNINKIIIGNSQPECAYNDSLIHNFKNLARSGETYFYNYQKLKALIKQNPQIDTVFIEFSNANIFNREDQKIWQTSYLNHFFQDYSFLINTNSNYLLLLKNPRGFQKALLTALKQNSYRIATSNYNYKDSIGGYRYLKRQKALAILDTLNPQEPALKKLNNRQISQHDLVYLDKIISLCKTNNIIPILIRSPFHPYFRAGQYEEDFQKVLKTRFKTLPFLDFKNFPLAPRNMQI